MADEEKTVSIAVSSDTGHFAVELVVGNFVDEKQANEFADFVAKWVSTFEKAWVERVQ